MNARALLLLVLLFLSVASFAQQADLELIVTPIGPGLAPWPTRFEFTVINHGPDRATNVVLTSPEDIDPLSEWANPTCSRRTADMPWRCTAATIESGDSAKFAGNIGPAGATQPYTFNFSVRATESDPNLTNNDVGVPIDWADKQDIDVHFTPPDPLGSDRIGKLVIDNRSDWPLDYVRFELRFENVKQLISTTPALSCRDGWPQAPHPGLVWLNCEMRGIAAHAKQEIAFEFDLPEQPVTFDVKVIWWLYEYGDRQSVNYARLFRVTSTADAGPGTLRQAILDANSQCTEDADITCKIIFAIGEPLPESTWFTIRPFTPLPDIHAWKIAIDGFTQQRISGDTNLLGPDIELDGSLLHDGDALVFDSTNADVLGLAIGNFPRHGIVIAADPKNQFAYGYAILWHNYIGIDPTGALARPNGGRGLVIERGNALVEGNVLSGNARSGAFFDGIGSATVRDNRIGVRAFDDTPAPNGASGIFVNTRSFGHGSMLIERNTIAHNGEFGIALAPGAFPLVQNNRIFANRNIGIDIGLDGPTLESSNYLVPPAPAITYAYYNGLRTMVTGTVPKVPGQISATPYSVDIYTSTRANAEGFAQGEQYIGSAIVQPDGTFRFEYAGDLRDQWISAIGVFQISWFAEYTISSTSEMSRAFLGR